MLQPQGAGAECCGWSILRPTHLKLLPSSSPFPRFDYAAEDVFNDGFWEGVDVVVNALDNVNARSAGAADVGGVL